MRILIADNETEYYRELQTALTRLRPQDTVELAPNGIAAFHYLQSQEGRGIDLLIVDEQMGGGENDGISLLRHLQEIPVPNLSVIYVTQFFNGIPAGITGCSESVTLFLDKTSSSDTLLFRAVLLVARQKEGPTCHPHQIFGKEFIETIRGEVNRILDTPYECYLSFNQQQVIGSLIRSFLTTLDIRNNWTADDILELSVFLVEGLCRVYNLHEDIINLVRKFLDFEEVLYTIPRYRDHFLHQIKVYLLGFCIINQLFRKGWLKGTVLGSQEGMKLWFIASAFHDIGYPFEKMLSWLNGFILGVLRSPADKSDDLLVPMHFNWGVLLGRRFHWSHIEQLVNAICNIYNADDKKRANILVGLGATVAENPDHALYSSLILQNFLRKRLLDMEVDPIAMAVALHNPAIHKIVGDALGCQLTFAQDPLSFLLTFCDTAQEWGRSEAISRKTNATNDVKIVFQNLETSDRMPKSVNVRVSFDRRLNAGEINDWIIKTYNAHIAPLRQHWNSGPGTSRHIGFSLLYQNNEEGDQPDTVARLEF